MDENEAARRPAEHKAAALHRLGYEEGAGATIWARVVADNLELHESARERFTQNKDALETWERLNGTALVLVVAIDQVLAFERRVSSLTDDPELERRALASTQLHGTRIGPVHDSRIGPPPPFRKRSGSGAA